MRSGTGPGNAARFGGPFGGGEGSRHCCLPLRGGAGALSWSSLHREVLFLLLTLIDGPWGIRLAGGR